LRCRRCRRGRGVRHSMSSARDKQLNERSRWRRAGQPERRGRRSMLHVWVWVQGGRGKVCVGVWVCGCVCKKGE